MSHSFTAGWVPDVFWKPETKGLRRLKCVYLGVSEGEGMDVYL